MRDGWHLHNIKIKFILFNYKIQHMFNCRFFGFFSGPFPAAFQKVLASRFWRGSSLFTFSLRSKTLPIWCMCCLSPHSPLQFVLQPSSLQSGVLFPRCPYPHTQETLLRLLTGTPSWLWLICSHLPSPNTALSWLPNTMYCGFLSLLLIKINLLHYLKYWNSPRFSSRLPFLFFRIILLF